MNSVTKIGWNILILVGGIFALACFAVYDSTKEGTLLLAIIMFLVVSVPIIRRWILLNQNNDTIEGFRESFFKTKLFLVSFIFFHSSCLGWHYYTPANVENSANILTVKPGATYCYVGHYHYSVPESKVYVDSKGQKSESAYDGKSGGIKSDLGSMEGMNRMRETLLIPLKKRNSKVIEYARIHTLDSVFKPYFTLYNSEREKARLNLANFVADKSGEDIAIGGPDIAVMGKDRAAHGTYRNVENFFNQNANIIDKYYLENFPLSSLESCEITLNVSVQNEELDDGGSAWNGVVTGLTLGIFPLMFTNSYVAKVEVYNSPKKISKVFQYRFYENAFFSVLLIPTFNILNLGKASPYRGYFECETGLCKMITEPSGPRILGNALLDLLAIEN